MTTLTRDDQGKTKQVEVGDELVVSLEENPTTGFTWAVEERDPGVLQLESSQLERADEALVGRGGQRRLTYRVAKSGRVELRLKLWRVWEGERSVVDQFATVIESTETAKRE